MYRQLLAWLVFVVVGCADDGYKVTRCEDGQGLNLDTSEVPHLGEPDAPVQLTLFGDFQCPPTAALVNRLLAFMERLETDEYEGQVQLLYRHFPLTDHMRARPAAIAAAAAYRQGNDAFWRLFPHLFKQAKDLTDADILTYAELAQLDLVQFQNDLTDPEVQAAVDRDLALAREIGFLGTPGVVLCGVVIDAYVEEVIGNLEYLVY